MSDFIDIYINERKKSIPHKCNICGGILQSLEDTISSYTTGGCRDCFISFLEPGMSLNGKDWIPSEEEISNWLKKKKVTFKPKYRFLGGKKC